MSRLSKLIAMIAAAWAAGLLIFIAALPDQDAARLAIVKAHGDANRTTAIVVFTGGGGKRIGDAMNLFSQGIGERMLISGVHQDTSRETIKKLWPGEAARFDCCVDLGAEAKTTKGNAAELDKWVSAHGFTRIILVTSDYHLPRAMIESRHRLGDIDILAFPTRSGQFTQSGWPSDFAALKNVSTEYTKYLLARVSLLLDQDQGSNRPS